MYNKKSQAAMEFLMTYGWAILIVLIVLATLFYLGIFNPSAPNSCVISSPFNCPDIIVSAAGPDYMLIGASGVSTASVTVTSTSGGCTASSTTLTNGQVSKITLTCTGVTQGQKVNGVITGIYTQQSSTLQHTITGTYSATAET